MLEESQVTWSRSREHQLSVQADAQHPVTRERRSMTSPTTSFYCKFPGCPGTEKEDTTHALFHCPGNNGIGAAILRSIQNFVPGLQAEEAIFLDFNVAGASNCMRLGCSLDFSVGLETETDKTSALLGQSPDRSKNCLT